MSRPRGPKNEFTGSGEAATPTDRTVVDTKGMPPGSRRSPQPSAAPSATHAARVVAAARSMPPARPGARTGSGDTQSDYSVTSRIDRLPSELTPAPLPPSPAAEAADVWFEQVPTNPAAVPDLNVLGGSRPDLGAAIGGSRSRFDTGSPAGRDPWAPPNYSTGPVQRLAAGRRAWLLPVLLTATALAVGMVLGALLFGGSDPPEKQLSIPADCPPAAPTPAATDPASTRPDAPARTPDPPASRGDR